MADEGSLQATALSAIVDALAEAQNGDFVAAYGWLSTAREAIEELNPFDPGQEADVAARKAKVAGDWWTVHPLREISATVPERGYCPDERCGETGLMLGVSHPKDASGRPNRCPTCLSTLDQEADRG